MRNGRRSPFSTIAQSPVLVGAITVLVTLVAVFLAYNANSGLPFVPTYDISVEVPDAAEVVPGNEVRIAGGRVGQVADVRVDPEQPNQASLDLKLDSDVEPLTDETKVLIRQRSNLGLKYVELVPGEGGKPLEPGASLTLAQAHDVVDLDDVLNVFDARVRDATQGALAEFGTATAGRSESLDEILEFFPPALRRIVPVAANLSDPATDLRGSIRGFESAASAIAPVAPSLAGLFDAGATTFAAFARESDSVRAILREAPPTEAVSTRVLHDVRPTLARTAALLRDLRPGIAELPAASDRLAAALETGTPVLHLTKPLARSLHGTFAELRRLSLDDDTSGTLKQLTPIVLRTKNTLAFANPFQTVCNYLGLWTRNTASTISQGDGTANWFRGIVVVSPNLENVETGLQSPDLHVNPLPDEGQNGQCETGNEVYRPGKLIGNTPDVEPAATEATSIPEGVPEVEEGPVK